MAQTVLVVEDEVKIRELLRSYLERAGLDVVTTGSGAEAITLAARAEPDLIILDLRLPDVPGGCSTLNWIWPTFRDRRGPGVSRGQVIALS